MSGGTNNRLVLMSDIPDVQAAQQKFEFSDAVRVGDTVWVSGVIAAQSVGETSYEAAFERAFTRLGVILARAGAAWSDVVEIVSYHLDPIVQLEDFTAVKARYIGAPFPAWTAVGTPALMRLEGIAEIKLVACVAR